MPNLDAWFGNSKLGAPSAASRAVAAWARIQDKPTEIIILRDVEGTLDAQTVRVEITSGGREQTGATASPGAFMATVFGVRDHPSVDDTDIQRGDTFVIGGSIYEVVNVVLTLGEVQAVCEVQDSTG